VAVIDVSIPSLQSRAQAEDLENALVGMSDVDDVRADVEKHLLVVTYDPALLDPAYLKRAIGQTGYPVDPERVASSDGT
jgi:hypothetical protein